MSIKSKMIRFLAPIRRLGLKNRDYTLICNNCYGGVMSRDWGLPYNSPTCGLYFFAADYLKFINDLPKYLSAEVEPMEYEESPYCEELLKRYPKRDIVIGKLIDVTLVFVHYPTFEEAKKKWERRAKRVNYENMVVKFNDQNLFAPEHFEMFMALPFAHKLFFTANPAYIGQPGVVYFPEYKNDGYVVDDIKPSRRHFSLKKYLNKMKPNE